MQRQRLHLVAGGLAANQPSRPQQRQPLRSRDSASERRAAMPDKSTSGSSVGAQPITGRAGADRCARNWANAIVSPGRSRPDPGERLVTKGVVRRKRRCGQKCDRQGHADDAGIVSRPRQAELPARVESSRLEPASEYLHIGLTVSRSASMSRKRLVSARTPRVSSSRARPMAANSCDRWRSSR
jgi:hypothetical protein